VKSQFAMLSPGQATYERSPAKAQGTGDSEQLGRAGLFSALRVSPPSPANRPGGHRKQTARQVSHDINRFVTFEWDN
jgi:hypothetical protein